jgi:NAD-dependent dihydropyrimidine dehydrogenase PreA subunit
MKPVINKEKCNNCGNCVDICPVEHFKKQSKEVKVVTPEQECLECQACVYACEQEAIKLKGKK